MDTQFLATFIVVVDSGSLAAAARQLDMAPTTVAQQIRALEMQFGGKLLERSGRTLRPSICGVKILDRARTLVRDAEDLMAVSSDGTLPAGPLRLGSVPTAMVQFLPAALRLWLSEHELIQINIEPGSSSHLIKRVEVGDIDAAIVIEPSYVFPKSVEWQFLREERMVLVTPLEMQVDDVRATIEQHPFVLYDRNTVGGKLAYNYMRESGLRPKIRFELDGVDHIAHFIAQGLGISIVPDSPLIRSREAGVARWPLPAPCPARNIGIVWLRGSVRAQLALEFSRMLQQCVKLDVTAKRV